MAKKGWVKIYRSINEHMMRTREPICSFGAWIDLLLMANYKKSNVIFQSVMYESGKGQLITSIVKLSKRWGRSTNWVRRVLKMFEKCLMIRQKATNRFTIITICNYSEYQEEKIGEGITDESTDESTGESTDESTGELHIRSKEVKKVKKEKKADAVEASPQSASSVRLIFEHWQKAMKHPSAQLDGPRKRKIKEALKNYSHEDLVKAIDGCRSSDWHMKSGNDELGLILRNAAYIEKFINFADLAKQEAENEQQKAKSAANSVLRNAEAEREAQKMSDIRFNEYQEHMESKRKAKVVP